jgi:hypothetical protein
MGDKSGVRVRSESSIEIYFYSRNVRCRERIKRIPTPRNIAYCTKLKAASNTRSGRVNSTVAY